MITITAETIEKIIEFTKDVHPKEFLAFFEGKSTREKIEILDIIFQPYIANTNSALPILDLPLTSSILGSIHSHPGHSNSPSSKDLRFFQKTGIIHAIICYPYKKENIQFYDLHGAKIDISIL